MYGTTTTRALNFIQRALSACAVVFVSAGGTVAVLGRQDRGFTLIAGGVLIGLVLLLLRLYRGRYKL